MGPRQANARARSLCPTLATCPVASRYTKEHWRWHLGAFRRPNNRHRRPPLPFAIAQSNVQPHIAAPLPPARPQHIARRHPRQDPGSAGKVRLCAQCLPGLRPTPVVPHRTGGFQLAPQVLDVAVDDAVVYIAQIVVQIVVQMVQQPSPGEHMAGARHQQSMSATICLSRGWPCRRARGTACRRISGCRLRRRWIC